MNETKYIIVIPHGMTKESARAVIFNGLITHSFIWEACKMQNFTLHSAGFVVFNLGVFDMTCYGESESCKVKSDPEFDYGIIIRTLRGMPLNSFE